MENGLNGLKGSYIKDNKWSFDDVHSVSVCMCIVLSIDFKCKKRSLIYMLRFDLIYSIIKLYRDKTELRLAIKPILCNLEIKRDMIKCIKRVSILHFTWTYSKKVLKHWVQLKVTFYNLESLVLSVFFYFNLCINISSVELVNFLQI